MIVAIKIVRGDTPFNLLIVFSRHDNRGISKSVYAIICMYNTQLSYHHHQKNSTKISTKKTSGDRSRYYFLIG